MASFILEGRLELLVYRPVLARYPIVYISFQTIAEMKFGALLKDWGEQQLHKLDKFFSGVEIIEHSSELAENKSNISIIEQFRGGEGRTDGSVLI